VRNSGLQSNCNNKILDYLNTKYLDNDSNIYRDEIENIFKRGSKTYYNSTKFFPEKYRYNVSRLYAFVRVVDDIVDSIPQNKSLFYRVSDEFYDSYDKGESQVSVINGFISLMNEKKIPLNHVKSFLDSMEMDLKQDRYYDLNDMLKYVYGSAEVIGLMMNKILDLPDQSEPYAKMLGRAMQYLNFIRDISEDNSLGRTYLPLNEAKEFGLNDLSLETVKKNIDGFNSFMNMQLSRFSEWDREARKGFKYMNARILIPIKTAEDIYCWTARKIKERPLIVYNQKVKPTPFMVKLYAISNLRCVRP
jgi:phytoene synthase